MKIGVLSGVYTNEGLDFRESYPRNMVPVAQGNGINDWYLRPADGITHFAIGPTSPDRGGINWKGEMYRVFGASLVKVSSAGVVTTLGSFSGATTGTVSFDYSFDRLAIAVSGNLYYWNGSILSQVTDPDIGTVLDMLWVDGYFMTTDGTSLVVTELNNPMAVNPLKYGSSEADSDAIMALLKIKNEVYALNRHTIELFDNVGGALFPFARIEGAQIQKGVIGTHACTIFMDAVAFLGGGRNEPPLVYLGTNGQAQKISTREIDLIIGKYTEAVLSLVVVEPRADKDHEFLYIHLPDQTLVYDGRASQMLKVPVWYTLASTVRGDGIYKARHFVWCYDKWLCGDPTSANIGQLTPATTDHYGNDVGWEFATPILYNDGMGAIVHEMELVCLTGRLQSAPGPDASLPLPWSLVATKVGVESWLAVMSGGGKLVAVGTAPNGFASMTSEDGNTWVYGPALQFGGSLTDVVHDGTKYVGVGASGSDMVATSTDGLTWVRGVTPAVMTGANAMHYDGAKHVAVGGSGNGVHVMTSTDGFSWALQTGVAVTGWNGITKKSGLYVAVGASGTSTGVMTSPDGITWTGVSTGLASNNWYDVTNDGTIFVAVGQGTDNVMTSLDGFSWTMRPLPPAIASDVFLNSIYHNGQVFIATGSSTSGNNCFLSSIDGITWVAGTSPSNGNDWSDVTSHNGRLVAVASSPSGSTDKVAISDHFIPAKKIDRTVMASHSVDGATWSLEQPVNAGAMGDRHKRIVWFRQGHFRNWRIQRFRGTAPLTVTRLEARLEALNF